MAVTITRPNGVIADDGVVGRQRRRHRNLVFSSNYATGGEAIAAATVGLKKIERVEFDGPAVSTDLATMNPVTYDYTTSKVVQFESGADNVAEAEKTNSEAYATGSHVRATFYGTGGI